MTLQLEPMTVAGAIEYLQKHGCQFTMPYCECFAISAVTAINDVDKTPICHGVIVMTSQTECSLVHMYTDGTALVGSMLYGAAWRAAKALGFKTITI